MYIIQKNKIKIQYFSWLKNIKKVARKKNEVIITKSYIFILRFSNFNLRDLGVKIEKTKVYN